MGKLDELYQDILMRHVNHPENRVELKDEDVDAEEYNPLCGDRVRMSAVMKDGRLETLRFDGEGCAICMASASIASQALSGADGVDADALCDKMLRVYEDDEELDENDSPELTAIAGVRKFPMRIKCATLPWRAARNALRKKRLSMSN